MFQQALRMILMLTSLRTTGQSRVSILFKNTSVKWPMSIPKWLGRKAGSSKMRWVRCTRSWEMRINLPACTPIPHMSLGRHDSLSALMMIRCWTMGLSQICDSVTEWWDALHLWLLEGSPPEDGGRDTTQAQAGLGSTRSSSFENNSLTGAIWCCRITYTSASQIPGELMREWEIKSLDQREERKGGEN